MKRHIHIFNFSIQNASKAGEVDIHIDGEIVDASTQEILKDWFGDETSVSFKSFRDQVKNNDASVYNVYVNSPGGHVGDALAIHDFLAELEGKGKTVNRIGTGIVASAGTYIVMGKNSSLTQNAFFMIHNVSGGVWGDVEYIENYAKTMRKFNDTARDFYSRITGLDAGEIEKMMSATTWMKATEAKEKGFVSNLIGDTQSTAKNKLEKADFPYITDSILNTYNSGVQQNNQPEPGLMDFFKKEFSDMKNYFKTAFSNSVKEIKVAENATPQEIANQIANTLSASIDQLEKDVDETITEKFATLTNQVTEANNKVAATEAEKAALETKNADLARELENKIANPTNAGGTGAPERIIGSFSKAKGED